MGMLPDKAADCADVVRLMIRGVSEAIARHCNRIFAKQQYVEKVPGYGTQVLQVTHTPIREEPDSPSITYHGEPIVGFELEDAEAGHFFKKGCWDWTGLSSYHLTITPRPGH